MSDNNTDQVQWHYDDDAEWVEDYLRALGEGEDFKDAASAAGVAYTTTLTWRKRDDKNQRRHEIASGQEGIHPGGKPPAYSEHKAETARKLALLGLTDEETADVLNIHRETFYKWKRNRPEFADAIKAGKEEADCEVAERLRKRALGYSHSDVKIFNDQGVPLVVPYTKHYAPDTIACIFWLKNRQPEKWRDQKDIDILHGTPPVQLILEEIDPEAEESEPEENEDADAEQVPPTEGP